MHSAVSHQQHQHHIISKKANQTPHHSSFDIYYTTMLVLSNALLDAYLLPNSPILYSKCFLKGVPQSCPTHATAIFKILRLQPPYNEQVHQTLFVHYIE